MRDFQTSRFKKAVGVNQEHYDFIDSIRSKKSKAGQLEEIIEYYIKKKKIKK